MHDKKPSPLISSTVDAFRIARGVRVENFLGFLNEGCGTGRGKRLEAGEVLVDGVVVQSQTL